MTDNLRPSQTNQMNTVFLEQRALNPQGAQTGNQMTLSSSIEREMADDQWQARQQLMKPILAKQYQWTSSQGPGYILDEQNFPEMLESLDCLMTRTLQMYAFFRMSPVFRFQLNATQFHQGQLIMSFDPFTISVSSTDTGNNDWRPWFNNYYATGLPNVKIMASESNPVELEVPYVHPRSYLTTNSTQKFDRMGTLRISVLNQLIPATGSTSSLTLSLWIYAKDASVHVPMYNHPLTLGQFQPNGLADLLGTGADVIGNVLSGNMGQAISKGIGGVRSLLSSAPVPGTDLQQCAENFLDYPAPPEGPRKTISPIENLAVSVGVSRAQRLALHPTSGHIVKEEVTASDSDNSDILKIARTPMMFDQIQWSASMDNGDLLYTIPIKPNWFYRTVRPGSLQPTYLAFVSQAFTYWRGGIRLDVEFVATRFHSGKLLVGFVPNSPIAGVPTFEQISQNNPCVSIDLQQTSSASFVVPYVASTPYKVTCWDAYNNNFDEQLIGTVYVFIQNTLACASNVSTTIDLNWYARGAEDFEVAVPNLMDNANYYRVKQSEFQPNSPTDIKIQTDRMSNVDDPQTAILSTGSGTVNPRTLFPEDYSLYSLVKRYSKLFRVPDVLNRDQAGSWLYVPVESNTPPTDPVVYISVCPLQPSRTIYALNTEAYISWFSFWAQIFSAWSGSIRYKFVTPEPRSSQYYMTVTGIPDDVLDSNLDVAIARSANCSNYVTEGLASCRTNCSQDNALEIEIPFYTPFNMLVMRNPSDTNSGLVNFPNNAGYIVLTAGTQPGSDTTDPLKVEMYIAAGEDFRFIYMRPPPCYNTARYQATTPDDAVNP